jgi:hypothetical protein
MKDDKHELSKILEEKKYKDKEDDMSVKKTKKYELLFEKNLNLTKKIKSIENHH